MRIDRSTIVFLLLLTLGGVLRIALFSNPGYESDLEFFRRWAVAGHESGLGAFGRAVPCNYMPFYLEILSTLAWAAERLGISTDAGATGFLVLLKAPANIADLIGTIALCLGLREWLGSRRARMAGLLYWWNPALLYTAAVWGQIDSLVCLFTLLALLRLQRQHWMRAGLFLGLAIMTKLQPVVLLPACGLFAWVHLRRGWPLGRALSLGTAGLLLAVAATILPFAVSGNASYVWNVLTGSVGFQPRLALGANNLWWLLFADEAKRIWDGYRWFDALSYRETGLIALAGLFAGSVLLVVRSTWRLQRGDAGPEDTAPSPQRGAGACARLTHPAAVYGFAFFLGFAFYMVPTQMHERYVLYCLPALLLAWSASGPRSTVDSAGPPGVIAVVSERSPSLMLLWLYAAVSTIALITVSANLTAAYPGNAGLLQPVHALGGWDTRVAAGGNVIILGLLLWWGIRRFSGGWLLLATPVLLLTGGLIWRTVEFRAAGVPLSELRPSLVRQDQGTVRMNTSASGGPLTAAGRHVAKGFGTRPPSAIGFRLQGTHGRLTVSVGLDERSASPGLARALVLGDRATLFDSGPLEPGAPPVTGTIDLTGVEELILLTQPASSAGGVPTGKFGPEVDWFDPRLFR